MALTSKSAGEFLKRYPIGISGLLLSVLVLGAYFLRSGRVSELESQLQDIEAKEHSILSEVQDAKSLSQQYSTIISATKELESRLLRGTDRARNQAYFYELEMETGVKEVGLQPSGVTKTSGRLYDKLSYSVSVTGDYRQILSFIGRVESGRHFYSLSSASVSGAGKSDASGNGLTVSLTMNAELLGVP
jgi:hypothetical protein